MVLVAPDFHFIQVNDAFCSILGYTKDELLGKTFQDVTHPDDHEIGKTIFEQLSAGKIPKFDLEKRYLHKNGNIVWGRVSGSLVRDADNLPYNLVAQIIDITENKIAEEALRTSRAKLDAALASMTDAVFISDASGNFIHFNDAFAAFHKFKNKEECAKTFSEYPHILDVYFENGQLAPTEMWAVPRALRGESATNTIFSFRRKDTGEKWIGSFSFSPIHDTKGTVVGSVVVGRDITEQMKAIEALKLSDQRYNALIQTTNDGFWVVDSEGNILEVNDSYCKMSGYTEEQLLGMKIGDLEFIETEVETKTRIAGILDKGWDRFESKHRHANGNLIDVDVSTFFLKEQNKILAFFNDTTKRKQAELALKQNHEMLIRLTDQVPGVVYQYRLYPDGRSCFPFSSVGMYNIYECTSEEVREDATPVFGRLHPDDYEMVAHLISESARTLELFHCEFRVILPKQGVRWRISNARPERMPDGGTLWYGIISDFTDYKLAEAELEIHRNKLEELVSERTKELNTANEELSKKVVRESEFKMMLQQSLEKEIELSEMKTRFISTTSHEFRTPLTAVLSSAELIQRYMDRWDDAKKNEHLDRIKNSVSYLTKLLDDVLTISRTETGKIIFNPDQIQLKEFANECVKDAGSLSKSHLINLHYAADEVIFTLDPKLMKFILNNLLSNAIKYSPDGGKIELVISNLNNNLLMEVNDEGIGIPEQEIDKIFDSFYRTKNAGNIAGTGLGLAIVKRAVELHNGVISVKSKLNEGTSFTVKIPINKN
jgi:PAS domain S-box-containing protein